MSRVNPPLPIALLIPYISIQTVVMAPKVISKGKEKGGGRGEGKSDRTKANRATSNKKLFLDLALEEKVKGNRLGKAFNAMGWENITKSFNEKMGFRFRI